MEITSLSLFSESKKEIVVKLSRFLLLANCEGEIQRNNAAFAAKQKARQNNKEIKALLHFCDSLSLAAKSEIIKFTCGVNSEPEIIPSLALYRDASLLIFYEITHANICLNLLSGTLPKFFRLCRNSAEILPKNPPISCHSRHRLDWSRSLSS